MSQSQDQNILLPDVPEPEYASIEAFVEFRREDGQITYDHNHLRKLSHFSRQSTQSLRRKLADQGLTLIRRAKEEFIPRGIRRSPDENRWSQGDSETKQEQEARQSREKQRYSDEQGRLKKS